MGYWEPLPRAENFSKELFNSLRLQYKEETSRCRLFYLNEEIYHDVSINDHHLVVICGKEYRVALTFHYKGVLVYKTLRVWHNGRIVLRTKFSEDDQTINIGYTCIMSELVLWKLSFETRR